MRIDQMCRRAPIWKTRAQICSCCARRALLAWKDMETAKLWYTISRGRSQPSHCIGHLWKLQRGLRGSLGPSLSVKSWSIFAGFTDQSRSLLPTESRLPTLASFVSIQVRRNTIRLALNVFA